MLLLHGLHMGENVNQVQSIKSLPPQRGDLALGDKLECEKYVATELKRNDSLW